MKQTQGPRIGPLSDISSQGSVLADICSALIPKNPERWEYTVRDTRGVNSSIQPPAPRPCESCPYRRDVPSGVWAGEEYDRLRRYDAPTPEQPQKLFQCHQTDAGSATRRICAGWAGCHGGNLLGLRIALLEGRIDEATYIAAADYQSPTALFTSGSEAADHGQKDLDHPGTRSRHMIDKITRTRSDLTT
ncbi:DUF6283 family protein [Streptomyces sp. MMBL 11-3]|uniref:DUF6283 family protein n=1 Tax=Streptomyces sp. MMBL 11-3 TaxID=3382639 RepID=UPI0039B45AE9